MKELFKKLLFFFSPFILITLLIVLVDPYNMFNILHLVNDDTKIKCLNRTDATSPRGNLLWRTIQFKRNPTPNIMLGTSRMGEISDQSLGKYFDGNATNLAFGGVNYRVIKDLFWMAAKTTKLKNVIIQAEFNTYSALSNTNLYEPARKIIDKPSSYFLNADIVTDAFALLYYSITKNEQFVRRSYKYRIGSINGTDKYLLNGFFLGNVYPKEYHEDLIKISEFCRKENINLIFFIAPDYCEVRNYIKDNNMEEEYNRFRSDIYGLGNTIDQNNGIPFSFKKDNYLDFFHVKFELTDTLLSMIFKPDLIEGYSRKQ
jgi:hypothetical protein